MISLLKTIEKTFEVTNAAMVILSNLSNAKSEAMQHWKMRIVGKVQGVGYRAFVCNEANSLNLKGFVRNDSDGSVLVEVEGDEDILEALIERCFQGPPLARVDSIDTSEGKVRHYEKFEIQR